jgi:hypothetical protein
MLGLDQIPERDRTDEEQEYALVLSNILSKEHAVLLFLSQIIVYPNI